MTKRWRILVGVAVVVAAGLGAAAWRIAPQARTATAATTAAATPARPSGAAAVSPLALPPAARVLVFSPHPDDETVAVGGLIHRVVRARLPLRVVFMTNGDGYLHAAQADFDVTHPTDDDYVALGELRQREALAALARLGVKRQQVRFLGFPDGGLADLWRTHWLASHPYTSPYTKENRPPEPDGVGYDGQDLTSVVSRVLRDFRPTVVVMPHPYDVHLDHAHTSYFVTEALTDLETKGELRAPRVLTYLVHYPGWPARRPPAFDRALPVGEVPDTVWTEAELSSEELAAKRAALAEYRSQLEVMDGFLHNFLCRNELFATVDDRVLDRIASLH